MDLGITGHWALVFAASKGLGLGCARALASEGVDVAIAARGHDALERAADTVRALPGAGEVHSVVAEIATPEGRSAALAACPQIDILINNAGGPPPGDFRQWERADWLRALDANMLAPIALIRATVDGMRARRFGRIINITSSAVKAPIDILGLSNGARAGLTGFVAGLACSTVADNVTTTICCPGSSPPTGCAAISPPLRSSRAAPPKRSPSASVRASLQRVLASRTNSAQPAPFCAARRPATSPGRIC